MKSERCCKRVYSGRSVTGYGCSNPAKVEVDGKWYCHVHDPAAVAKRKSEQRARWDAESKARLAQYKKEKAEHAAVSFLQIIVDGFTYDPGHSDLDDEQMIHVCMTLGDYRRARQLLSVIIPPTNTTPAEAKEKTR